MTLQDQFNEKLEKQIARTGEALSASFCFGLAIALDQYCRMEMTREEPGEGFWWKISFSDGTEAVLLDNSERAVA